MRINNKEQRPIEVNGINIEDVDEFTYLEKTVSTKGGGTEDISAKLNRGRQTSRRLNKTWNSSVYSNRTKIKLFNALVPSVVLFGSQTWKMTKGDNKKTDVFQSKCLCRIYWPYVISKDELLKRGQTQRWSEVVRQRR